MIGYYDELWDNPIVGALDYYESLHFFPDKSWNLRVVRTALPGLILEGTNITEIE